LQTETLTALGDFGGSKDQDSPYYWSLTYGIEKSILANSGAPDIVDQTYDYGAAIGWMGDSDWGLNLSLDYSNTPSEQLVARGAKLAALYRYEYGPILQGYSTYWSFRLIGGATNFVGSFNGQEPRKNSKKTKPVSGITELRQTQMGVDIGWKFSRTLKVDFEVDHFNYNRDVGAFENQLDSPLGLQMGQNGFTSTVGGLARVTYSPSLFWDFKASWRLTLTEQYSLLAADDSVSTATRLTISKQINNTWKVTLGANHLSSEIMTDTLALLGIDCEL
jgi:hypothetical protein